MSVRVLKAASAAVWGAVVVLLVYKAVTSL